MHQPRYSVFDRGPELNGPLAQGLLTDEYLTGTVPEGARAADSAFLSPDVIDADYREREVTSALIGASSPWQLDHNVRVLDFPPFTDDEPALIDKHGVHGAAAKV
ncbi:hypothetical protein [Streptomyces sp. CRN 30]|uniref:hypothetical protein n=1 Tax=Streptomyces sp. CRN 30 TaxID=3075613 RepID=UPI002A7FA96A|nr:hypothetical protein [Streptomyces sp. CRN 30]